MSVAFCRSQSLEVPRGYSAPRSVDPVILFVRAALLGTCIVCANANSGFASAPAAVTAQKLDPNALALLYNANFVFSHHFETISPNFLATFEADATTTGATYWPISNPSASEFGAMPSQAEEQIEAIIPVWRNASAVDSIRYVRKNHQLKIAAYQSSLSVLFIAELKLNRKNPELVEDTVVGVASWYNPYTSGSESPESETSSGEVYDPDAWTAAIQIKLRGQFGGVRYGRNYKPSYALVESSNKKVIVKINDVGPLKPGRVIDLSERTMRYFDRSLQLGLLGSVRVTPLLGDYWTPGPVGGEQLISEAVAQAWDAGLVKNEGSAVGVRLVKADMVTTTALDGGESATKPIRGEEPIRDAAVQAWYNDPISFAVDGSFAEADASSHCGQISNKIHWPFPECGNHAITEFVSRLADKDTQANRKPLKMIPQIDLCSTYNHTSLSHGTYCVIDLAKAVTIKLQATPTNTSIDIAAAKTTIIEKTILRTNGRLSPNRGGINAAANVGNWLSRPIKASIAPQDAASDKSKRNAVRFSWPCVAVSGRECKFALNPHRLLPQTNGRARDGPACV